MLELKNISFKYEKQTIFEDLNLDVKQGEILGLLGSSGSGKSTLLKIIVGLISPQSGEIMLNKQDITSKPTHLRGIGLVFQDNQLFPHMNVEKNIAFGLRMHGKSKTEIRNQVQNMLSLVGLEGYEKRKVFELSGGQAKRVALARSLAPNPKLLLLDEPLTGLDKDLHDTLLIDLKKLLDQMGTTSIFVTHDKSEAQVICDRILEVRKDKLKSVN
ncbi:MAG: ABC transporter ATP-binding protein [Acidimicrobiia bacterium]